MPVQLLQQRTMSLLIWRLWSQVSAGLTQMVYYQCHSTFELREDDKGFCFVVGFKSLYLVSLPSAPVTSKVGKNTVAYALTVSRMRFSSMISLQILDHCHCRAWRPQLSPVIKLLRTACMDHHYQNTASRISLLCLPSDLQMNLYKIGDMPQPALGCHHQLQITCRQERTCD